MTPTESLIHLAIHSAKNPVILAEIKAVMVKLMEGIKPTDAEMKAVSLAYQRDPIMCTLDYQDLEDFIEESVYQKNPDKLF